MNPSASAPSPQGSSPSAASATRGARSDSKAASKSAAGKPPPQSAPQSAAQVDSPAAPLPMSSPLPLGAVLDGESQAVVIAIPASPEYVRVVRLAVAGVATRMRFSYEQIEDIKLAVSEACNNAILHAQPPEGKRATQVVVRILPGEERLEITVFDQGRVPAPGLEIPSGTPSLGAWRDLDDLPEGGMGLMLIQALMDEVSSHDGAPDHTALHMVKHVRLL